MANIIVLGAGLVGGVMAIDLAKKHNVTSVDISQKNLDKLNNIKTICADISNTTTLQNLIKDYEYILATAKLLPNYGFPVGLNVVDKFAKILIEMLVKIFSVCRSGRIRQLRSDCRWSSWRTVARKGRCACVDASPRD